MSDKTTSIIINTKDQTGSGISSVINSLKRLDGQVSAVSKTFEVLGKLTVFSTIAAGAKKALDFAIECTNEYGNMQRTMNQLSIAVDGNRERFDNLNNLIEELTTKTLEPKENIEKLVAELASLGRSDASIKRITEASVALSNITGKDLNTSFTLLNATLSGSTGKLEKLITDLPDFSAEQLKAGAAIDYVNSTLQGQSDLMAQGWTQSVHNLQVQMEEFKETLGEIFYEILSPIVEGITRFIKYINGNRDALVATINAIGIAFTLIVTAINPIAGIIVGVITLINALALQVGGLKILWLDVEIIAIGVWKNIADALNGFINYFVKCINQMIEGLNDIGAYFKAKPIPILAEVKIGGDIQKQIDDLYKKIDDERKKKAALLAGPGGVDDSEGESGSIKPIANASWGNVDATKTPWALAAKASEAAIASMEQVNLELERQKYDHPYSTEATTSYSSGTTDTKLSFFDSLKRDTSDMFQSLKGDGAFSGISSALEPLTNILSPIIQNMGSFNIALAVLKPIIEGFVSVIGPAISTVIEPVMTALNDIGKQIGGILLPILEQISPIFNVVSQILMTVLTPIIQLIGASLSPISTVLQILQPILAAIGIAFTVLMAPVKWLADLFSWVGGILQTFVWNITHPFDGRGYSSFSSDAFSGLADRIAAITNAANPTSLATSGTTSYSGGSAASYTGPQNLYINVYNTGTFVTEDDFDKHTIKVVKQGLSEYYALGN